MIILKPESLINLVKKRLRRHSKEFSYAEDRLAYLSTTYYTTQSY